MFPDLGWDIPMKTISMFLLSIGLVGSLCGCLTIAEGERKNYQSYNWLRDRTGKPIGLPSIAQQQATVRATMQERVR